MHKKEMFSIEHVLTVVVNTWVSTSPFVKNNNRVQRANAQRTPILHGDSFHETQTYLALKAKHGFQTKTIPNSAKPKLRFVQSKNGSCSNVRVSSTICVSPKYDIYMYKLLQKPRTMRSDSQVNDM